MTMITSRTLLLALALWGALTPAVAGPVNKCVINGSVSYQQGPCPSSEVRKTPTLEELNAAEKKRRAEAAAARATTGAAAPSPAPLGGTAPAAAPAPAPAPGSTRPASPLAEPGSGGAYRCDGRLYCSQMRSCAEATWFLKHCPGVKLDGNHDGVPCEQQWCRP